MNSERFARLREIYGRLAEIPVEQRGLLINEWCEGDKELKAEIERMLEGDQTGSSDFLEPPTLELEVSPDDSEIEIPKQLGDYDLLKQLGEGGMGYVYLARQRSLNRLVALKLLPSRPGLQQKEIDRFLREAQSAAKLHHPRIVRIHDIESIAGVHFFAMDFVEGRDLGSEILLLRQERDHATPTETHNLPRYKSPEYFPAIVRIVSQIADALSHAHQSGIVHRDIKPQNILLNDRLEPFLVDFGLARDDHLANITMSGDLVGSPAYMSPEQVVGRRSKIDHRTDIYSLGVVLYELLTLRRPFEGRTSREVLNNVLEREPVPVRKLNPRVPVDLETICMTAISRSPEDRYATAHAFAIDCAHFLNHEAIEARPPSMLRRASIFLRRNRSESVITAVAVLAIFAAILFTSKRTHANQIQEAIDSLERRVVQLEQSSDAIPQGFVLETAKHFSGVFAYQPDLDAAQREVFERADQALSKRIEADMKSILGSISELASTGDSPRELVAALDQLMALATISNVAFPDQLVPSNILVYPSLTVNALDRAKTPIPATVHVCRYDPMSGEYQPDPSPTPANELRRIDQQGYYRIAVVTPDGRMREFARWLQTWKQYTLVATFDPDESSLTDGMIAHSGGSLFTEEIQHHCTHRGSPVRVPPFYLDRYEVSVADYLDYCARFEKSLPQFLRERTAEELRQIADRPATFLSYDEMREFAEANGKRLPTHFELEIAIHGDQRNHRKFAWGNERPEEVGARMNILAESKESDRSKLAEILDGTVAVHDGESSKSVDGVYHLQGNVSEVTETPISEYGDGTNPIAQRKALRVGEYVAIGESFVSVWSGDEFTGHIKYGTDSDVFRMSGVGFRCARSVSIVGN